MKQSGDAGPPPEAGRASLQMWLIGVLILAGGFAAMLGSALLDPGRLRLLLGLVGLVLVLAAFAVLVRGRAVTVGPRRRGQTSDTPLPGPQQDGRGDSSRTHAQARPGDRSGRFPEDL